MSRWGSESRRVIANVMRDMPAGASEHECRRALQAAYPFGRRENAPYRAWLKETRAALNQRFVVGWFTRATRYPLSRRKGRLWLDVDCGPCRALGLRNGCLECRLMRDALPAVVGLPELKALSQAAVKDDVALHALLDWCEERLGVRPDVRMQ